MKIVPVVEVREITKIALFLDKVLVDAAGVVDIARKINISSSTLYDFRNGKYKMRVNNLNKLFTYFQTKEPDRLELATVMYEKGLTLDDIMRGVKELDIRD